MLRYDFYWTLMVVSPTLLTIVILKRFFCAKDLPEYVGLNCALQALGLSDIGFLVRAKPERFSLKHSGRSFGHKRAFRMTDH